MLTVTLRTRPTRTRPARARHATRVTIVEAAGAHSPEWFAGTAVVVLACAVVLLLDLAEVRFVVGDDPRPAPRPPLH